MIFNASKASLTLAVEVKSFQKVSVGKIGPERICEKEFRICEFPKQKITEPEIATGSDQQIGL